ncbi:pantetheine-phosphate adenylyltransferase [Catellatospora paridis]|uniref:pantetheine-phosphate adenylyltransferase n=1 Tax=Catellatospora paridis TaxID=1617086 RepID=UPI0012D44677|nr:pantetheine-phosphate adenylyltransferase [Catellatospora paridis]
MPHVSDGRLGSTRAVYPGTFDPFTPGHFDIVDRARHMFDHVTVVVAVNNDKRPSQTTAARAAEIERLSPAGWQNVSVATWHGLTVEYCRHHGSSVIVRDVRNATDCQHECDLAATNDALGVTTMLVPTRPELATVSSTAVRALRT